MINKKLLTVFVAAVCTTSLNASAENLYAGLAIGDASYEASGGFDEGDTAMSLLGGFKVNDNIAAEVSYNDLGSYESVDFISFGLAAVGIYPINEQFNVFGKLGFESWEIDCSGCDSDGTDIFYGLGAGYAINKSFSVNLNYDIRSWDDDGDDLDITNISLGAKFHF